MSTHTLLRPKTIAVSTVATVVLIACAVFVARWLRRPDITDPAILATMPLDELRDGELETLVRAAFRNATSVHIETEQHPRRPTRAATITERDELDELAELFVVGGGGPQLPLYGYPGLTYVRVTFDGPYRPDFSFTSDRRIHVLDGSVIHSIHNVDDIRSRSAIIHTAFSKQIADLLKLEEVERQPAAPKP